MDLFTLFHRTIIFLMDGYNNETLLSDKENVSAHFRASSFMKWYDWSISWTFMLIYDWINRKYFM